MSTTDKIHIKIISIEGHTDQYLSKAEAVAVIKDQCNKQAKWLYIDGVHIGEIDTLNIDQLARAEDITLTNQLAGGLYIG